MNCCPRQPAPGPPPTSTAFFVSIRIRSLILDMEQGTITPTYVTPEAVERVMGTDSDERERRPDGQGMTLAS